MSVRPRGLSLAAFLALSFAPERARAAPTLAQCRRDVEAQPSRRESWGCFYRATRGGVELSKAEDSLRASMARGGAVLEEPRPRGYALLTLGNIVAQADSNAGLVLYGDALESLTAGGDHLAVVLTLLNMAHRFRVIGEPEQAAGALEAATEAALALGEPKWIATVGVESVRHDLRTHGDLGRAERKLADVEPLLFPDGTYQAKVTWLNASASVARRLGKLHAAHDLAKRLVAIATEAGDTYVQATGQYNVLVQRRDLRFEAGRPESTAFIEDVRAAVALAVSAQNPGARLGLWQLLADALVDVGELAEAESLARKSMAEGEEFGDPRLETGARFGLARALLRRPGALDEATQTELRSLIDDARRLAEQSGQTDLITITAILEAEVAWRSGELDLATAAHEASCRAFETVRSLQANAQGRAELLGRQGEVFKSYVAHLLEDADGAVMGPASVTAPGRLASAFEVSERYRARVLRETAASHATGPGIEVIRDAITQTQRRLRVSELTEDSRRVAHEELVTLERKELEHLAGQTSLLTREGLASVLALSKALGPDEALLSYQLGGQFDFARDQSRGSWLLVVTREQLHAARLPSRSQLRAALEMFGPAIEQGLEDQVRTAAQTLGQQLIEDPLRSLPHPPKQLTLLLDDQLHKVPFAAMRGENGQLLVEAYDLAIAPSATVLRDVRRDAPEQRARPLAVLALADPLEPSETPQSIFALDDARAIPLRALPHARREAERATHAPGDQAWFGADASETALLAANLDAFGVLHFATHAVVDETIPGRSAIVLAPGDADGLLQPRDVAQLALHGKLVVLSACQSAGGQVLSGEGVLGLAHSLLSGGATTVVGTQWPLPDDDATLLFERFYRELDQGRSVAAALAGAQASLAEEGVASSVWAGAVVLGDGSLVPFPGGRATASASEQAPPSTYGWRAWIGVLLAGLGLAAWMGTRRRRTAGSP
ncbi:MAG: CHAT domain-containing protein [Nannocystales bacterium]